MSTLSLPKAVLWDMDGTLVDSEPYWLLSESALAEDYGKVWTQESGNYLIGKSLYESSAFLKDHLDIKDLSAQQIIDRLTDSVLSKLQHSLPWRPGALELLMELKQAGVKTALVTMSLRRMAPYEKAAALLGCKPSECIAIEDSTTGLRSAEAAGCLPLGIVNLMPLEQTGNRVIKESLTGMNLDALRGLM